MRQRILQSVTDERPQGTGRRLSLTFRLGEDGGRIPAILQLPGGVARAPAALLLHGWSSRKEHMADAIGRALFAHGIASLAIALRFLGAHAAIDPARLAVVGYSLGAYLALALAERDAAPRAVVLAAGGDLPRDTPLAHLVRSLVDPLMAVRRLSGRPLLMVHGRHDRTIRPDQAERLFAAAGEPKEIQWWDAGHHLPDAAIDRAAVWLEDRLRTSDGGGARG